MNEITMELLKLFIAILGTLITYKLIPYIKAKTTVEQRKEAEYWLRIVIKFTEQIYKDKGSDKGALKKEDVFKWLNENGIPITESQANILIDLIVAEFNKKGWE